MNSLAEDIADGLAEIRSELSEDSTLVLTYVRREAGTRIPLPGAVLTKPVIETQTSQGAARREQSKDVLIPVEDLIDNGTAFEPDKDDTIEAASLTETLFFSLQPMSQSGSPFEVVEVDGTPIQFRVHTKLRNRTPAP